MRADAAAMLVAALLGTAPPLLTFAERYVKAPPAAGARVALTFDDLPVHAPLPPGLSRTDVARSILGALQARHAPPTYGFVNAAALKGQPDLAEVLRPWRAAGYPLASHTFTHMDLHANTAEAFAQDVLANEATLRRYMGDQDWHWLRYPYLHEGDTLEKQRAVSRFLKDQGYRVAEVTMSFDDWAYNDPYARCVVKNDLAAIDLLKESYLRRASESIAYGHESAKLVYGREIAHVMVLHVGGFQTVMLPRLLELLEQRGFRLVTLEEAQSDPAYLTVDTGQVSPAGATLLYRLMAAKGITPPATSDDTPARLERQCR